MSGRFLSVNGMIQPVNGRTKTAILRKTTEKPLATSKIGIAPPFACRCKMRYEPLPAHAGFRPGTVRREA